MKSSRLSRTVDSALWAFVITLIAASGWGFWHTLSPPPHARQQVALVAQQLNRLESALVQMERSLLGLAHANSRKVRFIGYDPVQLHAELNRASQEADDAVRHLVEALSGVPELEFQEYLIRLELEWSQMRAHLAEYLTSEKPEQVSLSTLRTFRFQGQGTLGEAVQAFKRVYLAHQEREARATRSALIGYASGVGVGFGIVVMLMWRRWGHPMRWLQRALTQSGVEPVVPAPLRGTAWEAIYQRLAFQERRLREVEVFMRDLAMGRIPEPITPTDSADALARSSAWLLKRFEELRSNRREAV
ncbi:MAG: hypothetical protein ACK4RG_08250 [Fimbriimonadales bacterium]